MATRKTSISIRRVRVRRGGGAPGGGVDGGGAPFRRSAERLGTGERRAVGSEFLCTNCWALFDVAADYCPFCGGARPPAGWNAMPYRFMNRYVFESQLGRGGMGAVFSARDLERDRTVAIKVAQQVQVATLRIRFANEQRFSAVASASDAFVKVLGYEVDAERPYLCLEHLDWPTLDTLLADSPGGKMTHLQGARITSELLRGIEYLHHRSLVHCDLKPGNLFVQVRKAGRDFRVKIADLGAGTEARSEGARREEDSDGEGAGTGFVGTLDYMSPEQLRLEPLSARSDLYSIGVLLWESVTGEVPFPVADGSPSERIRARFARSIEMPVRPFEMPAELYQIIARALAHRAADRWPSAAEMRVALETFVAHLDEVGRAAEEALRIEDEENDRRLVELRRNIEDAAQIYRETLEEYEDHQQNILELKNRLNDLERHRKELVPEDFEMKLDFIEEQLGAHSIISVVETPNPEAPPAHAPSQRPRGLGWILLAGVGGMLLGYVALYGARWLFAAVGP